MIAQVIEAQTARIDRTLTETYYQLGYQDSYQRRGMSGRMSSNSDYLEGWSDDYKDWKAQQPPVSMADYAWSEGSLTRGEGKAVGGETRYRGWVSSPYRSTR